MHKNTNYFGIDISKDFFDVINEKGVHYQFKNTKKGFENPLSVKRFIQMKLSKIKTDKSDAKMIYQYAQSVVLKLWKGESKDQQEFLQIIRMLSVYSKQSTALKNKIHGENTLGNTKTIVVKSIKRGLKSIKKEIDLLEKQLQEIVKKDHQDLLTRLESIPGLGRETSLMLIVLTDGFDRFKSASALCSYSGLTPTIRQSGSSIKGAPKN